MRRFLLLVVLWLTAVSVAYAEQKLQVGHYDIHYMALPSTFLTPAIAHNYGIDRSPYTGFLNVVVQDRELPGQPMVAVEISGIATNILDARFKLKFREIREGHSIYYLAECPYRDTEEIRFKLVIRKDNDLNTTVDFNQKFFND
ncbi:DUF4426 domain-containing protein [Shewanella dokdonensis]|uniref:DUF4426 domain-containing protein n=1 Tax=Shewanella dokdonensis TaxID=712036 RepID=A0ABX8DIX8_9GAMM|nr:DUF4426 domain-containing protein [Shewanella dokdonensis]MCL1074145.1 DUF4426 domain-containing protein [Shewanella dokdonensis]QVK23877.1 DUF4426 domain-containing protein [Shewanella dokdonensis]